MVVSASECGPAAMPEVLHIRGARQMRDASWQNARHAIARDLCIHPCRPRQRQCYRKQRPRDARGRVALRLLRAGVRDGRRRRRHPPHAFGPVDRRVAADRRHAAAAVAKREWQEAFAKYQPTPEYQQVNKGMTLDEFKGIFWWEYCHRLLGRADRRRVSRSVPVVRRAARHSAGLRVEARRHLRARRPAGRDGLVHGAKRPRRRSARVAVPADRASRPGAR